MTWLRYGPGTWAPFLLDSSNNIVYTTPPGTPIAIQFQTCNPNWAKNDTGSENLYYGRIYVPSSQSCVGLDAAAGTASLVSCLDSADGAMATAASAPQNFAFSTYDNISLYWYGASSQSTDYVSYDGCNGFYAYFHGSEYASPPNNTPVVTTGNLVQYQCDYYNGDTTIFGALRPTPAGTV
ncbi:hypothetical protein DL93DRAFT_1762756 [Clavulina sp. PMI_390]|nr:hypothetical protein DL93DRAFT_1762756 [Clavulina sp. PMI_390]